MEKCPNCGAAVRPGAKFCTSCGTRLNDEPEVQSTPTPPAATESPNQHSSSEETQVATPAQPDPAPQQPADENRFANWGSTGSGWTAPSDSLPSESTSGTTSPADRVETTPDSTDASAPDTGTRESESISTTQYRATGWGQPATSSPVSDEDRFATWAAAYGTQQEPAGEPDQETPEPTPAMDTSAPPPAASEANDVVLEHPAGESESRQRASDLIEELRSLVWKIGLDESAGDGDENLAVIVLAGARGQTGEFSDIQRAIDELKNDPRDIDALRTLGAKSDRIEELLASHSRLLRAIDEAINEIR